MAEIVVTMPIYWQQTKAKTVLVSLNAYRNWHYFTANKFKAEFAEIVNTQIGSAGSIESEYSTHHVVYFKRSNCDASNIVPVVEKVVLDALVTAGLLTGDSVKYHTSSSWEVCKDAENPRCVTTITKKETDNVHK